MAGTARDEAERLVAAVLAMAGSAAARDRVTTGLGVLGETVAGFLGGGQPGGSESDPGHSDSGRADRGSVDSGQPAGGGYRGGRPSGHGSWATGSAECCVCPVCRVIAGMRDPSPETAVKLAVGAGDLATGVASVMRAFSAMTGDRPRPASPARPRPADPDQAWSAATHTANRPDDAWSAATNARPAESSRDAGPAEPSSGAGAGDAWSAATGASAARASAEHAVEAEARAARRAAEQAVQREAARAAAKRAKEAAERVAEAVRLADAGRGAVSGLGSRTPRKLDVWAAATADAGVAAVAGSETLDHDGQDGQNKDGPNGGGGVAGDGARDGDAV